MVLSSAARTSVGNLPHELTSFVGRRREVTETRRSLSASRLVTLTGIGGVGKTRLALRVAHESQRAFPDGVWFVEFGGLTAPELVHDAVATAFGIREVRPGPPDALVDFICEQNVLLVLDNCEHLVGAAAELAGNLLRSCRNLRILATSREPLGVSGEKVLRVPPLGVPDPDRPGRGKPTLFEAVTLFEERAVAVVPGFDLNDTNRAAVTRICQRLDGLPLPIELAAARLRALSPDQIAARLTDTFMLLNAGGREAPSRQQTLRLCIDWSHDLCTPREREAWSRLSVFGGRFELDAAEAICAETLGQHELLDVVTSLVDKSILIRDEQDSGVGYRMLETLRDYGREKLELTGDGPRLRRRHRDWYETFVAPVESEWIGPQQARWRARLQCEQPNLRAATQFCLDDPAEAESGLRIATATWPYALSRGQLQEGRYWLERALAHQGGEPTVARAKALCAYILLSGNQGHTDEAEAYLDEARAVVAVVGDPVVDAELAYAEGNHALFAGDMARALELFPAGLDVFRGTDPLREVSTLLGMGLASGIVGEVDRAVRYAEESLAIAEARGDAVYRAYGLLVLALTLVRADRGRARGLLHRVVRLEHDLGDPLGTAMSVEALAWVADADGEAQRAAVLLGAAQSMWSTFGSGGVSVLAMRTLHDDCVDSTRRALGDAAFTKAFRRGLEAVTDDAVAYALRETNLASGGSSGEASTAPGGDLTRRERQIADLVAEGLTNRAIAERLVISPRTVEGHVEHALTKLGFRSRSQIAAWVAEQKAAETP
ncbi:ATP-binding protein [Rhodococcus gannanensis]|uniref:ATP-binding protein n=1 Tax=Rhodococcus gannanensis TaxID=1960308 RepID=A0ABW4PE37_9NOCA